MLNYENLGLTENSRSSSFNDAAFNDLLLSPGGSKAQVSSRRKWRVILGKAGNFLTIALFVGLVIMIPILTVYGIRDKNTDTAHTAFYSSAAFVLLTFPISVRTIVQHLQHWHIPRMQRYVVRILWMVPLYSLQSWLSLRFHDSSLYIETLRDCYEAYCLSCFLYYIIEVLGGPERINTLLLSAPESAFKHPVPFNWIMQTWEADNFLRFAKNGVLQYIVVKVFCAFLVWILEACDVYEEGSFRLDRGYFYIAFITNLSQCVALYVLVKIYLQFELQMRTPTDFKPHYKFLCVKGVVFATWWQGVGIAVLQSNGIIRNLGEWSADDVASGLQDYLITVEMLMFAVAHSYTFGYEEYERVAMSAGDDESFDYENSFITQASSLPTAATFREALWSSSVPSEMRDDFKQFTRGRGKKVAAGGRRKSQSRAAAAAAAATSVSAAERAESIFDSEKPAVGGEEGQSI